MNWGKGDDTGAKRGYHHGNLREALITAALDLIAQKGPAGFTFAEAARAAGVSPAAPYRHFRDRDALMADVAHRGFEHFEQRLDRGLGRGPAEPARRARAHGPRLPRLRPRRARLLLGHVRKRPADRRAIRELHEAGDRAFAVLREACEAVVADLAGRRSGRPP